MMYFWLGLILLFVILFAAFFYFESLRNEDSKILDDKFDWFKKKFKLFGIIYLILVLGFIWVVKKPLWQTVGCQYDGHTQEVETKFDWIKSICYFKTKSGTWMPLIMGRDSAVDKNHNNIPDTQEQQQ